MHPYSLIAPLFFALGCRGNVTDDGLGTEQSELGGSHRHLDEELGRALWRHGFTGRIEATLEERLGRAVDHELADLGRLLFFDNILGLHGDNSCAGCHAPANGFGDSQPIAIGVDNNGIVGKNRRGPRNQRRSPLVVNTAFYPALMWTARFSAISGNPFDSPEGFQFPSPENVVVGEPTLLAAQGSLPRPSSWRWPVSPASRTTPDRSATASSSSTLSAQRADRRPSPERTSKKNAPRDVPGPARLERAMSRSTWPTQAALCEDRGEVARTLRDYEPHEHAVPADLQEGPFQPVLDAGIDHLLARNVRLSSRELAWLMDFVENALLDPRVLEFCELVPSEVPSGLPLAVFDGCE